MSLIDEKYRVLVVGGRPGSGKTAFGKCLAKEALGFGKNVFYWHAEGPEIIDKRDYGADFPDDLERLTVNTDLNWSSDLLTKWVQTDEDHKISNSVVVIDVIDFLSEPFDELASNFNLIMPRSQLIVLSLFPRYLENQTADHAEEYLRNHLQLQPEFCIKIIGNFNER